MTANGQGWPKYENWNSISQEPMMIEKLKMTITTKSKIDNVGLYMKYNRITNAEDNFPLPVCWQNYIPCTGDLPFSHIV